MASFKNIINVCFFLSIWLLPEVVGKEWLTEDTKGHADSELHSVYTLAINLLRGSPQTGQETSHP